MPLNPSLDPAFADLETKVAGITIDALGRRWDPSKHPRDSRGRFIETGGIARVGLGGLGKVIRSMIGGKVEVEMESDGSHKIVPHEQLTMVRRPDGSSPTASVRKVVAEDAKREQDPNRGDGKYAWDKGNDDVNPADAKDDVLADGNKPAHEQDADNPYDGDDEDPEIPEVPDAYSPSRRTAKPGDLVAITQRSKKTGQPVHIIAKVDTVKDGKPEQITLPDKDGSKRDLSKFPHADSTVIPFEDMEDAHALLSDAQDDQGRPLVMDNETATDLVEGHSKQHRTPRGAARSDAEGSGKREPVTAETLIMGRKPGTIEHNGQVVGRIERDPAKGDKWVGHDRYGRPTRPSAKWDTARNQLVQLLNNPPEQGEKKPAPAKVAAAADIPERDVVNARIPDAPEAPAVEHDDRFADVEDPKKLEDVLSAPNLNPEIRAAAEARLSELRGRESSPAPKKSAREAAIERGVDPARVDEIAAEVAKMRDDDLDWLARQKGEGNRQTAIELAREEQAHRHTVRGDQQTSTPIQSEAAAPASEEPAPQTREQVDAATEAIAAKQPGATRLGEEAAEITARPTYTHDQATAWAKDHAGETFELRNEQESLPGAWEPVGTWRSGYVTFRDRTSGVTVNRPISDAHPVEKATPEAPSGAAPSRQDTLDLPGVTEAPAKPKSILRDELDQFRGDREKYGDNSSYLGTLTKRQRDQFDTLSESQQDLYFQSRANRRPHTAAYNDAKKGKVPAQHDVTRDGNALAAITQPVSEETRQAMADNKAKSDAERIARFEAAAPVGTRVRTAQGNEGTVVRHSPSGAVVKFDGSGRESHIKPDELSIVSRPSDTPNVGDNGTTTTLEGAPHDELRDPGSEVLGDVPAAADGDAGRPGQLLSESRAAGEGQDSGRGGRRGADAADLGRPAGEGRSEAGSDQGSGSGRPERSGVPAAGAGDRAPRAAAHAPERSGDSDGVEPQSFRAESQDDLAQRGQVTKLRNNLDALRTLRKIEAEGRTTATPEEQKVLARWAGWGAIPQVFDESNPRFAKEREELRTLIPNKDEWNDARENTLNAHYTDLDLVKGTWEALQDLGFNGGTVLEPGAGSGNFIGTAPAGTKVTGVEKEHITGKIAQLLYPQAAVRIEPFEDTKVGNNVFDAAIGNVPFGKYAVHDPEHNPDGFSIHNAFILKSINATKPGGLVAIHTSRFTMDGESPKNRAAREAFYKKADLLGAIRLPEGAHASTAGTDVVTDLLIFRKRKDGEAPGDDSWLNTSAYGDGDVTAPVNDYFVQHPENVLGDMQVHQGGQYGADAVNVTVKGDPAKAGAGLREAAHRIAEDAKAADRTYSPEAPKAADEAAGQRGPRRKVGGSKPAKIADGVLLPVGDAPDHLGEGVVAEGDKVYTRTITHAANGKPLAKPRTETTTFTQVFGGQVEPYYVPKTQQEELRHLIGLRNTFEQLKNAEAASDEDNDEVLRLRKELNDRYDNYAVKFGAINRFELSEPPTPEKGEDDEEEDDSAEAKAPRRIYPQQAGVRYNPAFANVFSLDDGYDPTTKTAIKAHVFDKRTIKKRELPTSASTPEDALALVQESLGHIDLDAVAKLLGKSRNETLAALAGKVFEDPETGQIVSRAEYLSGNIRAKIKAIHASGDAEKWKTNLAELESVKPEDKTPANIMVTLGAPWIDAEYVEQFAQQLMGNRGITVENPGGSMWTVRGGGRNHILASQTWGTKRKPFHSLLESMLTQAEIKVYDEIEKPEGGTKKVLNPDATLAAQDKAEEVAEKFAEWLWQDPERARTLLETYNDRFNSMVGRTYDGSPMRTYPGMAAEWSPMQHQNDAVTRIVHEPAALLAHVVGAGKTAEMTSGAMELRRLGLAQKPAIVVPNHMLAQWNKEFLEIYPQAKVLTVDTSVLDSPDKRRTFLSRVRNGDWDAVIMTQESFKAIPMTPENERTYLQQEVDQLRRWLESAKKADGKSQSVKKIETQIKNAEARIKKLLDKKKDTGALTFEETGIDYLMVDEAHMYKNLRTPSSDQSLAKVGSQKATDLDMKLWHLRNTNTSGRVVTFATGTPIANSISESYVMQKFLRPDLLEEAGIEDFDSWVASFAEKQTVVEMTVAGKFRQRTRFSKFRNLSGLLRMWSIPTDTKLAEDLTYLKRPNLKPNADGERLPGIEAIPSSDMQAEYLQWLGERAERIESGLVTPDEDNLLKIASDGRKAAFDMRLVNDPEFEERYGESTRTNTESGKINRAADNIARIYEANKDRKYAISAKDSREHETPGGLQIVFADLGTPKDDGRFSTYTELKDQLVARGVPAEKIAFIHDYPKADDKARLFEDARTGKVAVLVGSTEKMGTGTNVQNRALALHHLDVPWRPADLEQREGRVIRQGNQNTEVEVHRYVTEGTFDAFMWGAVERKAGFIQQMMRGSVDQDEIEDVSDVAADAAMVKSIASGNPLLVDQAFITGEVRKLRKLAAQHKRNVDFAERVVREGDHRVQAAEKEKARFEKAIAKRQPLDPEKPTATLLDGYRDRDFTGKKEVQAALGRILGEKMDGYMPAGEGYPQRIGAIGGLNLVVRTRNVQGAKKQLVLSLSESDNQYDTTPLPGTDVTLGESSLSETGLAGIWTSLTNRLEKLDNEPNRIDARIESIRGEQRAAQAESQKVFGRQDDLDLLETRAKTLDEALQKWDAQGDAETAQERDFALSRYKQATDQYEKLQAAKKPKPAPKVDKRDVAEAQAEIAAGETPTEIDGVPVTTDDEVPGDEPMDLDAPTLLAEEPETVSVAPDELPQIGDDTDTEPSADTPDAPEAADEPADALPELGLNESDAAEFAAIMDRLVASSDGRATGWLADTSDYERGQSLANVIRGMATYAGPDGKMPSAKQKATYKRIADAIWNHVSTSDSAPQRVKDKVAADAPEAPANPEDPDNELPTYGQKIELTDGRVLTWDQDSFAGMTARDEDGKLVTIDPDDMVGWKPYEAPKDEEDTSLDGLDVPEQETVTVPRDELPTAPGQTRPERKPAAARPEKQGALDMNDVESTPDAPTIGDAIAEQEAEDAAKPAEPKHPASDEARAIDTASLPANTWTKVDGDHVYYDPETRTLIRVFPAKRKGMSGWYMEGSRDGEYIDGFVTDSLARAKESSLGTFLDRATIAERFAPKEEEPNKPSLEEQATDPTVDREAIAEAADAAHEEALAEGATAEEAQIEADVAAADKATEDADTYGERTIAPAPAHEPKTPVQLEDEAHPLSAQQQPIADAVVADGKSVKVEAKAGAGKTSTLVAIAKRFALLHPDKKIGYIAFNKSVQTEAEGRFPSNTEPRTGHSVAFVWRGRDWTDRKFKNPEALRNDGDVAKHLGITGDLNGDSPAEQAGKVMRAVNRYSNSAEDDLGYEHFVTVDGKDLLDGYSDRDKVRMLGYAKKAWKDLESIDGRINVTNDHIRKMWALSRPDFTKPGSGLRQPVDVLFLDEAQDTPPVLAKVIADQNLQKVIVGDGDQAIYGFTGAVDYLDSAEADESHPLTKSYRFGKQVADWGNRFLQLLGSKQRVVGGGPDSEIVHDMEDADAILTRSNGGMFSEILREQEKGRTVGVPAGTKADLRNLIASARYLRDGGTPPKNGMHEDLAKFRTWQEFEDAVDKGDDQKLNSLDRLFNKFSMGQLYDIVESLVEEGEDGLDGINVDSDDNRMVLTGATAKLAKKVRERNNDQSIARLIPGFQFDKANGQWVFRGSKEQQDRALARLKEFAGGDARKPDVTVSTAHKSKGLEWGRVRIGDDFRGPDTDEEGNVKFPDPEELRLAYVAVTRAEKALDPGSLSWVLDYTNENGEEPAKDLKPKRDEESVSVAPGELPQVGDDVAAVFDTSTDEAPTPDNPRKRYGFDLDAMSDEELDAAIAEWQHDYYDDPKTKGRPMAKARLDYLLAERDQRHPERAQDHATPEHEDDGIAGTLSDEDEADERVTVAPEDLPEVGDDVDSEDTNADEADVDEDDQSEEERRRRRRDSRRRYDPNPGNNNDNNGGMGGLGGPGAGALVPLGQLPLAGAADPSGSGADEDRLASDGRRLGDLSIEELGAELNANMAATRDALNAGDTAEVDRLGDLGDAIYRVAERRREGSPLNQIEGEGSNTPLDFGQYNPDAEVTPSVRPIDPMVAANAIHARLNKHFSDIAGSGDVDAIAKYLKRAYPDKSFSEALRTISEHAAENGYDADGVYALLRKAAGLEHRDLPEAPAAAAPKVDDGSLAGQGFPIPADMDWNGGNPHHLPTLGTVKVSPGLSRELAFMLDAAADDGTDNGYTLSPDGKTMLVHRRGRAVSTLDAIEDIWRNKAEDGTPGASQIASAAKARLLQVQKFPEQADAPAAPNTLAPTAAAQPEITVTDADRINVGDVIKGRLSNGMVGDLTVDSATRDENGVTFRGTNADGNPDTATVSNGALVDRVGPSREGAEPLTIEAPSAPSRIVGGNDYEMDLPANLGVGDVITAKVNGDLGRWRIVERVPGNNALFEKFRVVHVSRPDEEPQVLNLGKKREVRVHERGQVPVDAEDQVILDGQSEADARAIDSLFTDGPTITPEDAQAQIDAEQADEADGDVRPEPLVNGALANPLGLTAPVDATGEYHRDQIDYLSETGAPVVIQHNGQWKAGTFVGTDGDNALFRSAKAHDERDVESIPLSELDEVRGNGTLESLAEEVNPRALRPGTLVSFRKNHKLRTGLLEGVTEKGRALVRDSDGTLHETTVGGMVRPVMGGYLPGREPKAATFAPVPGVWKADGDVFAAGVPGEWAAGIKKDGDRFRWETTGFDSSGFPAGGETGFADSLEDAKQQVRDDLWARASRGEGISIVPGDSEDERDAHTEQLRSELGLNPDDETPAASDAAEQTAAPAPDVDGQPAGWVPTGDLQPGDVARVDGDNGNGSATTHTGHVLGTPETVTVHTGSGKPDKGTRTTLSDDRENGLGDRETILSPEESVAARVDRPDDNGDSNDPRSAFESQVLSNNVGDTMPLDATGRGLFPGSLVERNGKSGLVTEVWDNEAAVRWAGKERDERLRPGLLTITEQNRPEGWTNEGRLLQPGHMVELDGGQVGKVESITGDDVEVSLGDHDTRTVSAGELKVVGKVADDAPEQAPATSVYDVPPSPEGLDVRPAEPVKPADLPEGTAASLPNLTPEQRQALIGLGIDTDAISPIDVQEAAARIRFGMPITAQQAEALVGWLDDLLASDGLPGNRKKGLKRVRNRVKAAGDRAGAQEPEVAQAPQLTKATGLAVGDVVAVPGTDGELTVGRVALKTLEQNGNAYRVVVEHPDGTRSQHMLLPDGEVYVLPDLPEDGAVSFPEAPATTVEADRPFTEPRVQTRAEESAEAVIDAAQGGDGTPETLDELAAQVTDQLDGNGDARDQHNSQRRNKRSMESAGLSEESAALAQDAAERAADTVAEQVEETVRNTVSDAEPLPGESDSDAADRTRDRLREAADQVDFDAAVDEAMEWARQVEAGEDLPAPTPREQAHARREVADALRADLFAMADELAAMGNVEDANALSEIAARLAGKPNEEQVQRAIDAVSMGRGPSRVKRLAGQVRGLFTRAREGFLDKVRAGMETGEKAKRSLKFAVAAARASWSSEDHDDAIRRLVEDAAKRLDAEQPDVASVEPTGFAERVAFWRDQLPQDSGMFGRTDTPRRSFRGLTLSRLRSGEPLTAEETTGSRIDRAADGGPGQTAIGHYEAVKGLGGAMDDEIASRVRALVPELGDDPAATVAEAKRYAAEVMAEERGDLTDDELAKLRKKARKDAQRKAQAYANAKAQATLEALAQVRPMGPRGAAGLNVLGRSEKSPEVQALHWAEQFVPTDWLTGLDSVEAQAGRMGSYVDGTITVAPLPESGIEGAGKYGTSALHGLAQHLSANVPGLATAAWVHHWSKTSDGEPGARTRRGRNSLTWLMDMFKGAGFTKDDGAVRWTWDYQEDETGQPTQIIPAGFEDLFGEDSKDEDLRKFMLGLLAWLARRGA